MLSLSTRCTRRRALSVPSFPTRADIKLCLPSPQLPPQHFFAVEMLASRLNVNRRPNDSVRIFLPVTITCGVCRRQRAGRRVLRANTASRCSNAHAHACLGAEPCLDPLRLRRSCLCHGDRGRRRWCGPRARGSHCIPADGPNAIACTRQAPLRLQLAEKPRTEFARCCRDGS
ncbi:hypothetical protein DENSPDRAFT_266773 [Dentipellis sp. KUC8613]|nr:hypothetical protein DENSPDRAFT_266773 [Dentipellis sp. KUC8613]